MEVFLSLKILKFKSSFEPSNPLEIALELRTLQILLNIKWVLLSDTNGIVRVCVKWIHVNRIHPKFEHKFNSPLVILSKIHRIRYLYFSILVQGVITPRCTGENFHFCAILHSWLFYNTNTCCFYFFLCLRLSLTV